jgi:hypothetical protein
METDTVVRLARPGSSVGDDPLLLVLRDGARRMLQQVIEAEIEAYLGAHTELEDGQGRRRIVRNGHAPECLIQTGIGPIEVRRPPPQAAGGLGSPGESCATAAPTSLTEGASAASVSASPRRCCRRSCAGRRTSRSYCPLRGLLAASPSEIG